jgi:ACS family sodium-dependent inorganic phosphate cotransporter
MTLHSLLLSPLPRQAASLIRLAASNNAVSMTTTALTTSRTFTFLSALAVAISYADRSNLSTAIIPMTEAFHWDNFFSGLVLSSFWLGYGLTNVLGGKLADKFGGETLLIVAMIMWSACTALTPYSAVLGNSQLLACRVLLGAGEGLALPSIHTMIQKYVPQGDSSLAAGVVTSACYLGALFSNLLSPLLIDRYGYEACFYAFAVICPVLWLPLWNAFIKSKDHKPMMNSYADESRDFVKPRTSGSLLETEDSLLTMVEIKAEEAVKVTEKAVGTLNIKQLLGFKSVWAIMIAQYCQSWGMIGILYKSFSRI